ncbi:MAG: SpoVR family protein, partial [Deltaproteobacteria bacterium]
EYLWGGTVQLETSEVVSSSKTPEAGFSPLFPQSQEKGEDEEEIRWERVLYTMEKRKLSRKVVGDG